MPDRFCRPASATHHLPCARINSSRRGRARVCATSIAPLPRLSTVRRKMCARDFRRAGIVSAPALGLMAWLLGGLASAQTTPAPTAPSPAPAVKQIRPGAGPAAPAQSADGRYGIVVLAATVNVHEEPSASSPVIVKLDQGLRLDADQRRGNWY